jgi:hypothetical protein
LLDEAETYLRDDENLRGVLNAGHRRDGAVVRTVGDVHEPRQFSAWAAVALAAIGRLPSTLEDRSLIIRLRRRLAAETVEPLRTDRAGPLDQLARQAARWARDYLDAIASSDPVMPVGVINRLADNWRPLVAVADIARGAWPELARAAIPVSASDDQSIGVAMLTDVREAFSARGTDRISSDELVAFLIGLDERPWSEFKKGKPLTKAQLARSLAPFGVSSSSVRLPDGRTPRGYLLSWFDDAFARYLPA